MATVRPSASSLLMLLMVLGGCTPTCSTVCKSVIKCGADPSLTQSECELSCTRQNSSVNATNDDILINALNDELRCVEHATCTELADGLCYDPSLFPY